ASASIVVVTIMVPGVRVTLGAREQAPSKGGPAARTQRTEPDLQGIWEPATGAPLQRDPKYGQRELLTDEDRLATAKARSAQPKITTREDRPFAKGSEQDVNGGYNTFFCTPTRPPRPAKYTSQIVDPPDGRIPPMTTEATRRGAVQKEFTLALMQ